MSVKSLKIDSLDLDLENPRITLASDQRDAMQKILNEQKARLINLAESIAAKGFSPMDGCLVLRSNIRAGKFIVLEGSRRLLAAKLLKNPALISTLEMPDAFKKRLLWLSLTEEQYQRLKVNRCQQIERATPLARHRPIGLIY